MKTGKTLITVLGWEDRYVESNRCLFEEYDVNSIIIICFEDYITMTNMSSNLQKTISLSEQRSIESEIIKLKYEDSVNNWNVLETFFGNKNEDFLLNITTIPRDTIWTLFFFLKRTSIFVSYAYFKPKKYSESWLTKNHQNPRLLFKHSGLMDLNKQLALVIISGFDIQRLDQIITYYEPQKIVIFAQKGEQFRNLERNNTFQDYLLNYQDFLEILPFDSYNVEESTAILKDTYLRLKDEYNIIVDSQGPKISALSVYDLYLYSKGEVALAYVAAKDFHDQYSAGFDQNLIKGDLDFKKKTL